MKTIGLIGGMSWESTIPYYRHINEVVKAELGGLNSAKIVLYSVNFNEIERLQHVGDWDAAGEAMAVAAKSVRTAGADFIALCTNTMHRVADHIERAVDIPLLHIAVPTATSAVNAGVKTVGLLGTSFTMEQAFYRRRLSDRFALTVLTPDAAERDEIHRIIYSELCMGRIENDSREIYRTAMKSLVDRGAQAIILGCTEISLLVGEHDATVPLLDTTLLHARAIARYAMGSI